MTIQPRALLNHIFPDARQRFAKRDLILYALGVGLGVDPTNPADLPFLLEDRLRALPTFAVTLGSPGMWIKAPEFGVDFARLVHYEQAAEFHASLPVEGEIVSRARVASVADRGDGRGALVVVERAIQDAGANLTYCTLQQTLLLRGDGGFGGPAPDHRPSVVPDRQPDVEAAFQTDPRAALIYRLSGDWNRLHADPEAARRAGFARPILHGLATYAIAGATVARACGVSPDRVTALSCRFSSAVLPGDRIEFRVWREPGRAAFQAYVGDRKALDRGLAAFESTA